MPPLVPRADDYQERVRIALSCRDADALPRVEGAGGLFREGESQYQLMHQGVKVWAHRYCGEWMTDLIRYLGGVHEPQEEVVFHRVLEHIPPGGVMLELGAYWGYYSLWFARRVPGAVTHLIEASPEHLEVGVANFRLNGATGTFTLAQVGESPGLVTRQEEDGVSRNLPRLTVDDYLAWFRIPFLHILHCDVDGAEKGVLLGCRRTLEEARAAYVFVSTHNDRELHGWCREFLRERGYSLLAAHTMAQSYSYDGLLAARSPRVSRPGPVTLSLRGVNPAGG
ncbi:MAG: FkbM family methyltransferase [Deltaproteobacteria bacterium]|nr:FkbM family methyltransferase [Deltaproteobacteria bacterium]